MSRSIHKKIASLVLHIISEQRITCRGWAIIQEQFTIKSYTNGLNEEGNVA